MEARGAPHGKPWGVPREPSVPRDVYFTRGIPRVPAGIHGIPWDTAVSHEEKNHPAGSSGMSRGNCQYISHGNSSGNSHCISSGNSHCNTRSWVLILEETYVLGWDYHPVGRVVGVHGIPRDALREIPWDPAGKVEGVPTGLYDTPWVSWDPVGRRMSYRGSPIGFRASPMGSPGFPRKFSGPHGKSHCTVVVHTSIQQPFYEFDLIVEYSVKMELIYSTTIVIHLA